MYLYIICMLHTTFLILSRDTVISCAKLSAINITIMLSSSIYLIFLCHKICNEKVDNLFKFSMPFVFFLGDHWTGIAIGDGSENVKGREKGRDWIDIAAAVACDHLQCADHPIGAGW